MAMPEERPQEQATAFQIRVITEFVPHVIAKGGPQQWMCHELTELGDPDGIGFSKWLWNMFPEKAEVFYFRGRVHDGHRGADADLSCCLFACENVELQERLQLEATSWPQNVQGAPRALPLGNLCHIIGTVACHPAKARFGYCELGNTLGQFARLREHRLQ